MQLQNTQGAARRPFVMLNAPVCEPTDELLKHEGYYDPDSQTWVGRIEIGAGTYSSRSSGSSGDYRYQSDD
jgi:hypothetical protein